MEFVPEQVLGLAQKLAPAADAMRDHAKAIGDVGFDPGHTGQDYKEQGQKLADGVTATVAMLHSWSDASAATVQAFQQAATAVTATDDQNRARIEAAGDGLGPK